jgi:hypothetical protein
MAFRRSDLQEAFFVPGTHAFRVWGYGTTDPLEEMLAPGYFEHAGGLLRPGELIYVSTEPRPARPSELAEGEVRVALVMVRADERTPARAAGTVRWCRTSAGRAIRQTNAPRRNPDRISRRLRSSAAVVARPAAATRNRPQFLPNPRNNPRAWRDRRIPCLGPAVEPSAFFEFPLFLSGRREFPGRRRSYPMCYFDTPCVDMQVIASTGFFATSAFRARVGAS